VSPNKRHKFDPETPDNASQFPLGSFLKMEQKNPTSFVIRNENSIARIIGETDQESISLNDTLLNTTMLTDS
jgi:hypothetical protein